VIWIEKAGGLVCRLAFAAVGLAASLGNFLRLASVGSAGMATRSLAGRAFGAVVSALPAPQIVVGDTIVGVVGVVGAGARVGVGAEAVEVVVVVVGRHVCCFDL